MLLAHTANMPLPIAGEIDRLLRRHRQPGHAVDLFAVADAAVVLPPPGFLSVAKLLRTGRSPPDRDALSRPDELVGSNAGWPPTGGDQ